jgi:chromosome segregation ATPase
LHQYRFFTFVYVNLKFSPLLFFVSQLMLMFGADTNYAYDYLCNNCAEFDKQVQSSKVAADEALSRIAEIERLIDTAESQTEEAANALTGAEVDARRAKDIAKQAQETAEEASKEAGEVLNDLRLKLTSMRNYSRWLVARLGKLIDSKKSSFTDA